MLVANNYGEISTILNIVLHVHGLLAQIALYNTYFGKNKQKKTCF